MLIFDYRPEVIGGIIISRPHLTLLLHGKDKNLFCSGLLDSGADRTIIPGRIADALNLPKGRRIETFGIGGTSEGYESILAFTFVDKNGKKRILTKSACLCHSRF